MVSKDDMAGQVTSLQLAAASRQESQVDDDIEELDLNW